MDWDALRRAIEADGDIELRDHDDPRSPFTDEILRVLLWMRDHGATKEQMRARVKELFQKEKCQMERSIARAKYSSELELGGMWSRERERLVARWDREWDRRWVCVGGNWEKKMKTAKRIAMERYIEIYEGSNSNKEVLQKVIEETGDTSWTLEAIYNRTERARKWQRENGFPEELTLQPFDGGGSKRKVDIEALKRRVTEMRWRKGSPSPEEQYEGALADPETDLGKIAEALSSVGPDGEPNAG